MRLHRFGMLGCLCLCGTLVVACSQSGSVGAPALGGATSGAAGAIPLAGQAPRGRAGRAGIGPMGFGHPCSGSGLYSFVGGTGGNIAAGGSSGVLSGGGNFACDSYSGIGTGDNNTISSGSGGNGSESFIGAGIENAISQYQSFIGSGSTNTISAADAVIGGGYKNNVSGIYGIIGGGGRNAEQGEDGAIGGGWQNTVSAKLGTVSGGFGNQATAEFGTVPGGELNIATGYGSFAAGIKSWAANTGAFVWSDDASGATQVKSSASNQFLARASGGVKFFSNASLTTGVTLAAGSGTWASLSDRAVKTNVATIDDAEILNKVAAMPISEWSYISEHGVRHVGPMAQDFYAAFGVGGDNRHITSIDEDGVALAAIKALHQENRYLRIQLACTKAQQARKDAAMQRRIDRLATEVEVLRSR